MHKCNIYACYQHLSEQHFVLSFTEQLDVNSQQNKTNVLDSSNIRVDSRNYR